MTHPSITQRGRSHFSPLSTTQVRRPGSGWSRSSGFSGRDAPDCLVAIHRVHRSQSTGAGSMGPSTVLFGSDQTPHHQYMQIGGSALQLSTEVFLAVVEQRPSVRNLMLRFVHVFMTQTAQSALVNGSSVVEERLARWVLMCRDRLDMDEFPITHDFLSMMLGERRSSVTDAIHLLEGDSLIRATRGNIKILDRVRLERAAGASYGVPEAEFRRLIGQL